MLPDHELHLEAVRKLAADSTADVSRPIEVPKGETANFVHTGVAAPIFMGTSPVIPERYVLHFSETKCKACGTTTRDSEFFALSYLRSRINGSRVRHLTRCDSPQFNLPVDVVKLRTNVVPFCCECEVIDLSHLPPPPQAALVYDLAEPRLKGQKPREAKPEAKKPSTKATLDDLA